MGSNLREWAKFFPYRLDSILEGLHYPGNQLGQKIVPLCKMVVKYDISREIKSLQKQKTQLDKRSTMYIFCKWAGAKKKVK